MPKLILKVKHIEHIKNIKKKVETVSIMPCSVSQSKERYQRTDTGPVQTGQALPEGRLWSRDKGRHAIPHTDATVRGVPLGRSTWLPPIPGDTLYRRPRMRRARM